jgi:hypothetical protein
MTDPPRPRSSTNLAAALTGGDQVDSDPTRLWVTTPTPPAPPRRFAPCPPPRRCGEDSSRRMTSHHQPPAPRTAHMDRAAPFGAKITQLLGMWRSFRDAVG